jgi:UDPglucose 6-dehydrogenase
MIGTGYVGLVSGACFAELGHVVTCIDQDETKIAALKRGDVPIYEPGLGELLERNAERLAFTIDLAKGVADADVVFLAVGTPSRRGDGEADLSFVHAAARQIAPALRPGTVVVIKSTVVVGTARAVRASIKEANPHVDFSIASNPEFLREGSAIEDFLHPDRVVVGVEDERARTRLAQLYRPLSLREAPVIFTTLENAEITKYAANAFLAMKITFINEVANFCEAVGGDVQDVARAIGLDNRIGAKFLHPGPGFGGSCFPKDTRAFAAVGRKHGAPLRLVETTMNVNNERLELLSERVKDAAGGSVKGLTIGVLGIAFKPNTDDCREAASLTLIPALQAEGAKIRAHDPRSENMDTKMLPGVIWCDTPYQAATDADMLVILTEWNEYRALDLAEIARAMSGNVIVDMRNIYRREELEGLGLHYLSVGRPAVKPAQPAIRSVGGGG